MFVPFLTPLGVLGYVEQRMFVPFLTPLGVTRTLLLLLFSTRSDCRKIAFVTFVVYVRLSAYIIAAPTVMDLLEI
jgi:hypothetical protein